MYSSNGTFLTQWGSVGSGNGQFNGPFGVAVDAGGSVYVADTGNNRIQKFGPVPTPTKTTSWGRLKSLFR
jgi:DNA-binding beta-propeller fold protein YncE